MGEVKGDLCWSVSISSFTDWSVETELDELTAAIEAMNMPHISVKIERRPPPITTQDEDRIEQKELAQMADMQMAREASVAELQDLRKKPPVPRVPPPL